MQDSVATATLPAASSTKTLDVCALSIFHFAPEAKLTDTLLPPDNVAAICGIEVLTMYGAVPPLMVNRALLDEQYALNGSAVSDKVGGDTARSVVAVGRAAEPGAVVYVPLAVAPVASVTVSTVLPLMQAVESAFSVVKRAPDFATVMPLPATAAKPCSLVSTKALPAGKVIAYGALPP